MDCNSSDCVNAKNNLQAERAKLANLCIYLNVMENITNGLQKGVFPLNTATIVAFLILALIAVVALGLGLIFVAAIVGMFAIIALIVWALSFYLTLVFGRVTANIAAALVTEQMNFQNAAAKVIEFCPKECQGDLTLPSCQH